MLRVVFISVLVASFPLSSSEEEEYRKESSVVYSAVGDAPESKYRVDTIHSKRISQRRNVMHVPVLHVLYLIRRVTF